MQGMQTEIHSLSKKLKAVSKKLDTVCEELKDVPKELKEVKAEVKLIKKGQAKEWLDSQEKSIMSIDVMSPPKMV